MAFWLLNVHDNRTIVAAPVAAEIAIQIWTVAEEWASLAELKLSLSCWIRLLRLHQLLLQVLGLAGQFLSILRYLLEHLFIRCGNGRCTFLAV